jgi:catechol 2,3-dioxygenase-like lactoylglutathione lyase family enzyme
VTNSVPWAAAAFVLSSTAHAQPQQGWIEAVVSVREFGPTERLFTELGGWRLTAQGSVHAGEIAYWKLPSTARATFRRLCAPQAKVGCIRLVQFKGIEQQPIRPSARPWDTGGIFSLMVRSDDVNRLYRDALQMGWWAESPPVRFQFGTSDLNNVVLTGPHGINVAAYERISPPFSAFPVGRISQAFNTMRMVRNQPEAKAFFERLGFSARFDADFEPLEPSWSNFSIPLNFTPIIRRKAAALQPHDGEWGRVEVMQIVGFEGRDHSELAQAPNLGILSVRYPVQNLAGYRATLSKRGITSFYSAAGVPIAGIGTVEIFAVRDQDGSLTEFYEPR